MKLERWRWWEWNSLPSYNIHVFLRTIFICFCFILIHNTSQIQAAATTDATEVKALNSIFQGWGIKAGSMWNTSGEPCSSSAIDDTDIENSDFNPGIKCDCGYNNGSTCHITKLRVYALNVPGTIPQELVNLTFLTYLKLDQNYLTGSLPAFLGKLSSLQTLSVGINALSGTIPNELGQLQNLQLLFPKCFALLDPKCDGGSESDFGGVSSLTALDELVKDFSLYYSRRKKCVDGKGSPARKCTDSKKTGHKLSQVRFWWGGVDK